MNIALPPPPNLDAKPEWLRWFERLWRYVRPEVARTGDGNAEISSATTYHGVTTLTAPRSLTLPSVELLRDGDQIIVQDESGSAGAFTITISGPINGGASIAITTNYGRRLFIKSGTKYFAA